MEIDTSILSPIQILELQSKYRDGKRHLKYFADTMKLFRHPERRLKTFDTIMYERDLPFIEQALKKIGKI